MGLWPGALQSRSVLLVVVVHVGAVQDLLDPSGVFKVPVNGPAEAVFKGDPGVPAKLFIDLCRIQGISPVMVKITISRESHIG